MPRKADMAQDAGSGRRHHRRPPPMQKGVGVVAADAVTAHRSLTLTTLPDDLLTAVDGMLPPRWSRNNPVDLAAGETRDTIPELLDMVTGHPGVDSVVQLSLIHI